MSALNDVARKLAHHPTTIRDDLTELLGASHRFRSGDIINEAGRASGSVTFVESGIACRATILPDGRRHITALLLPGDAADLETLFIRSRPDSIQALTDAKVWLVPRSRLRAASALTETLLKDALLSAEICRAWVVNGRRSALERLAHLLCELSVRMEAAGLGGGHVLPFPLSQAQLGDVLGLSVVHVNRTMQHLRGLGLIELRARRLRILDGFGLKELAGFDPYYLGLLHHQAASSAPRRNAARSERDIPQLRHDA